MSQFPIILADPPWEYRTWSLKGNGIVGKHYDVMTPTRLASLPVERISHKDCILLMWATFPTLPQALALGAAWGFEYKTAAFLWVKQALKSNKWFFGLGHWTRANAEPILLFTRGNPKRLGKGVSQILSEFAPENFKSDPVLISRIKRHSEKPDMLHVAINALCGDIPRIELFARQQRDGWLCLGNEITGRDISTDLNDVIEGKAQYLPYAPVLSSATWNIQMNFDWKVSI